MAAASSGLLIERNEGPPVLVPMWLHQQAPAQPAAAARRPVRRDDSLLSLGQDPTFSPTASVDGSSAAGGSNSCLASPQCQLSTGYDMDVGAAHWQASADASTRTTSLVPQLSCKSGPFHAAFEVPLVPEAWDHDRSCDTDDAVVSAPAAGAGSTGGLAPLLPLFGADGGVLLSVGRLAPGMDRQQWRLADFTLTRRLYHTAAAQVYQVRRAAEGVGAGQRLAPRVDRRQPRALLASSSSCTGRQPNEQQRSVHSDNLSWCVLQAIDKLSGLTVALKVYQADRMAPINLQQVTSPAPHLQPAVLLPAGEHTCLAAWTAPGACCLDSVPATRQHVHSGRQLQASLCPAVPAGDARGATARAPAAPQHHQPIRGLPGKNLLDPSPALPLTPAVAAAASLLCMPQELAPADQQVARDHRPNW